MAKGRSHRGSRDVDTVANLVFRPEPLRPSLLSRSVLDPVHDLRIYHPYRELLGPLELRGVVQPVRSIDDLDARGARVFFSGSTRQSPSYRTDRFGNVRSPGYSPQKSIAVFQEPRRVPVCVRRKERREVLFAKGKSGRGYRKPRWNERSYMRCR